MANGSKYRLGKILRNKRASAPQRAVSTGERAAGSRRRVRAGEAGMVGRAAAARLSFCRGVLAVSLTHGLEVGLLVHRKGKVPEASLLKGEGEQRVREVWHRYIAARTEKGAPCGEREEQMLDDFWRSICLSRIAGWVAEGMHLGIALGGQTEDLAESCMPSRGQKSGIDATNE